VFVFPVRYELNSYISLRWSSVLEGLIKEWKILYSEELHCLCSLLYVVRISKPKRMRWRAYIARFWIKTNAYTFLTAEPEKNRRLQGLNVDTRIISKCGENLTHNSCTAVRWHHFVSRQDRFGILWVSTATAEESARRFQLVRHFWQ
jgi:hypothetical protein